MSGCWRHSQPTTPIRPKTIKESRRNRMPQKTVSRFRLRIVFRPRKIRRDPGPSKKRPVPDLAYGDSSKALVVEAIWNLPAGDLDVFKAELQQGKSLIEAAQSAGGQFAIVHRKIAEYTLKIEAILSESRQQSMFPTSSIRHLKKRWSKSSATSN